MKAAPAFALIVSALTLQQLLASQPAPAAGPAAAAARVDAYLSRLVPYGFSGAVLIAHGQDIVLKKGYGLADREQKRPYTPDLVASIGSVTKQFTAAAILELEDAGKLRTSDEISKYLPDVPPDKAGITIHHLLTHTAGFPGDLGGADNEAIGRDALVARVLAAPLASKPGAGFEYSNEGYSLAGAIVERVSGQGYEAFLREHLFLPAGMRDTGYLLPAWPLERLPVGYGPEGQAWGRIYKRGWLADGPGWYLRANGGIHSTLEDMLRWHRALDGDAVLSPAARQKFQTGHVDAAPGERYAYGWGVRKTPRGTTLITHNGGNGFFFADVRRYVDEGVVIIAMSNQPVVPATQLAAREIERLYFNEGSVAMPPLAIPVPRERREALAGTYRQADGSTLTLRTTENGLEADASDPLLFATDPVTPPGGRFATFESRTLAIVNDAARGNFRPIFEAFNDDRPFDVVQGNQRKIWDGWRTELGEFTRAEVLGTALNQGDPGVVVNIQFQRGRRIAQFVWGPRRLVGFRVMPSQPIALVAESPSAWVYYRYRLRQPIVVRIPGDGSITVTREGQTWSGRKS